ncbi:unnamed protein product [Ambrosiozyma monospora]|uniref:Unnamed protein product n=1 Tax=Ambrosiozyma monospora TaxID=43982 RepID=A0A9W6YXN9_AMBMO|nr:unnamed protein product [Ambrosiozyma monospora]
MYPQTVISEQSYNHHHHNNNNHSHNRPYLQQNRRCPPAPLSISNQHLQAGYSQMPNGTQVFSVPVSQVPGSPTTPFDVAYATGMLPRQLLVSSPFISSPGVGNMNINCSPTNDRFKIPSYQNYQTRQYRAPSSASKNSFSKNLKTKLSQVSKSRDSEETIFSRRDSITDETATSDENEKISLMDHPNVSNNKNDASEEVDTSTTSKANGKLKENDLNDQNIDTRTLKFTNLRSDIELKEFLDFIEFGPIEECVFCNENEDEEHKIILLSFVYIFEANKCYSQFTSILDQMRTALESPEMEILPIESSELSDEVQSAIENDGATRAIHISNFEICPK